MHFITSLLYKIKNCKDNQINLLGTGNPLRQFMYAGDLAQVIKLVIEKDIYESFNVATPENLSIKCIGKSKVFETAASLYWLPLVATLSTLT